MRNWLSQVVAVSGLNLRTLKERKGASAAAAFGVAGVVTVFVAVLSIAAGFKKTMESSGAPDVAVVLRKGSSSEMVSGLRHDMTRVIADAPGVKRTANGPAASSELFVVVDVPKRSTGTAANVPLRGVQPAAFDVHNGVQIVSGRRFEPGKNEVIVGQAAASQFAGLDVGSTRRWDENVWTVVGIFGDPTRGRLPIFFIPAGGLALGVALALLLGLATGAIPAVQAMRLRIVDALRRV